MVRVSRFNEPMRREVRARDPRCRGKCLGPAKEVAPGIIGYPRDTTMDSPAVYAHTRDNRKGLFCTCCNEWLLKGSRSDFAAADAFRFGRGAVPKDVTLYFCPRCDYELHSAKDIVAE